MSRSQCYASNTEFSLVDLSRSDVSWDNMFGALLKGKEDHVHWHVELDNKIFNSALPKEDEIMKQPINQHPQWEDVFLKWWYPTSQVWVQGWGESMTFLRYFPLAELSSHISFMLNTIRNYLPTIQWPHLDGSERCYLSGSSSSGVNVQQLMLEWVTGLCYLNDHGLDRDP